jgi:hypothetical protein
VIAFVVLAVIGLIAYGRFGKRGTSETTKIQTETKAAVTPPPPPTSPTPATERVSSPQPSQPAAVVQKQPSVEGKDTAKLTVNNNPPTAAVFVDGKSTGMKTPSQLQLPRGEHLVSVQMEGFKPSAAKFRVKGGEELEFSPELTVNVPGMPNIKIPKVEIPNVDVQKLAALQKQKEIRSSEFWQQWAKAAEASARGGALGADLGILVRTRPDGAHIWIDGNDTGQTSPAIVPKQPGTYKLRVQLDGFEPVEKEVKVEAGKPAMVNIPLKPKVD